MTSSGGLFNNPNMGRNEAVGNPLARACALRDDFENLSDLAVGELCQSTKTNSGTCWKTFVGQTSTYIDR